MSKRCHPLATAGKNQHKTPLTSCTHHRDLLGKAAGNGRTARDSARCERVKLNICNGSIFKTPVGLGLWLSEGSGSRSQKAVGAHDSHAAQKAVGVKHPSARHQHLLPRRILGRQVAKCCLITSYSAGTGVSLVSCIWGSYFLLPVFITVCSPPPFLFLQVANINSGNTKRQYLHAFQCQVSLPSRAT